MCIPAIDRQLELACAALGHAAYFLEIEAIDHATQHLNFAKQQLNQLSDVLKSDRSSIAETATS